jgi:hypothetical protein
MTFKEALLLAVMTSVVVPVLVALIRHFFKF